MPDSDTTLEHDEEAGELIREEPVEVTAEVIHVDDTDVFERQSTRSIVIRQVLHRQLVAGQDLSAQWSTPLPTCPLPSHEHLPRSSTRSAAAQCYRPH